MCAGGERGTGRRTGKGKTDLGDDVLGFELADGLDVKVEPTRLGAKIERFVLCWFSFPLLHPRVC